MQECFEVLRTYPHANALTQADVDSAMECYSKDYYNFTISDIELLTDLHIERNKRNGRKQADHIKLMNFVRDEINHNINWRNGNGRPSKKHIVFDWLYQHPFGKKIECERDTHLSRHTVLKWWDICKSEVFSQMDQDVMDFCMEDSYSDDINTTKEISINGTKEFSSDDLFPIDSKVVITYYTGKESTESEETEN